MREQGRVIALGFFDGVHLGHGALLRRVSELACAKDAVPAALTFSRLITKSSRNGVPVPLLTTPEDRVWLMEKLYGIREVEVLSFDRTLMELPWDRFITEILRDRFHAVHVVAGHDYRFGYRGEGDTQKLAERCAQLGIGCDVIDRVELEGITVSSTYIRSLIEAGDMDRARAFLGHPHILSGRVVHGNAVGRTIGVPTANLLVPQEIITPAFGVYAALAVTEDGTFPAVTNVGVRPTVHDGRGVTVEPWLLGYRGDLYGKTIRVEFYRRLRGERQFASLEQLRAEILRNADQTRAFFHTRTDRCSAGEAHPPAETDRRKA